MVHDPTNFFSFFPPDGGVGEEEEEEEEDSTTLKYRRSCDPLPVEERVLHALVFYFHDIITTHALVSQTR